MTTERPSYAAILTRLNRMAWRDPVRVAATENIASLSGLITLQGVALEAGDSVLTPLQDDPTECIVWVARSGAWTERPDFRTGAVVQGGTALSVTEGTYAGEIFRIAGSGPKLIGTDALSFGTTGLERTGAAIQAQLDANGRAVLQDGVTYELDEPLDVPSGGVIECSGIAFLAPSEDFDDAAGVSDPDDRTVSLIRIRGAASGTVNTTLSVTANQGDTSITLTNASGANAITAGVRLMFEGTNEADEWSTESDSEVLIEHVQVDSSYVSGTTIPLTRKLAIQHATGKPVVSYSPNNGATLRGVELVVDTTAKTIPVGIEATNAINVRLERVTGRGFSRAVIDMVGCDAVTMREIVGRGDSNADVLLKSVHHCDIDRITHTGEHGRVHDEGVPRWVYNIDDHCVECSVTVIKSRKTAGGGAQFWGGLNCTVEAIYAQDVDCTAIRNRNPDYADTVIIGSVFQGGPADLDIAVFGESNRVGAIECSAVTGPNLGTLEFAVYVHDQKAIKIGSIKVHNLGDSPQTAGSYLNGVLISDSDGSINSIECRGCRVGLMTQNALDNLKIDTVIIDGSAGEGASGSIGILYDHKGGLNTSPSIRFAQIGNVGNYVYFGTEWLSGPDRALTIDAVKFDGFIGSNVKAIEYSSGTSGTVMRINDTAAPEASGPADTNAIAMIPSVNGWGLVAYNGGLAKHTSTAAVTGNLLVADSSGNLVVGTPSMAAHKSAFRAVAASSGGYVAVERAR